MKLLKLKSGSTLRDEHWRKKACRTRNSVSRARSKRQSKDLMEWMEETAMAVENRRKNAGRGEAIFYVEPDSSTQGMEVLFHAPPKTA